MSAPTTLALDAAHGRAAACLLAGERAFAGESDTDLPHSQALLPLLAGLLDEAGLAWDEIELLALGTGPGSFTGLRVAAATLAGVNASLGRPMLELPSLGITALQAEADELYVVEDARAGEAFVGHYREGCALEPDACLDREAIASMAPAEYAAHREPPGALDGWRRLPLSRSRPEALAAQVRLRLNGFSETGALPRYLAPRYIQPSQAERNRREAS